ncbi:hypothetical protein PAXINDRAFT_67920 [Paxillus involutus ATCC 200175]|nr:hypothetical protein PAXINDRAFT_67920 [Paxillus involutus ATCC 200175]
MIMLPALAFLSLCVVAQAASHPLTVQDNSQIIVDEDVKVPVVLGVMSRCPDAILCETVWDRVLQRVGDKVDISLSFIATPNASDPVYGLTCMHGAEECAGNVHELCVAKYHPTSEWWPFLQCQNFRGRDQIGLPDTAVSCATTAGFKWENDQASECAGENGQGEEGVKLLQASVKNSIQMGIQKSCTIIINGKQVCIRDGTWYECEGGHTPTDFIRQINEEHKRLNSAD